MRRRPSLLLPVAAVLAAAFALPAPVLAETAHICKGFIDSVPATISQQGVWCLRQDLSTSITSGSAITVAANNVSIDCNNFKIGGLAAGTGTVASGILAAERSNLSVRRCSIRGFRFGVATTGGGGHVIERNAFDGNTLRGIHITSPGSTIRGNRIVDTGGSTALDHDAHAVFVEHGVDVVDNTITGVAPSGVDAAAYGIYSAHNGKGSIIAHLVRGLAPGANGTAYGIFNFDSDRVMVRDNDVQGSGVAGSVGVHCSSNQGAARDNIVSGFASGISNCLSSGNTVNSN